MVFDTNPTLWDVESMMTSKDHKHKWQSAWDVNGVRWDGSPNWEKVYFWGILGYNQPGSEEQHPYDAERYKPRHQMQQPEE